MRITILQPPRDSTHSVRIHWSGCPNKSGCQTWGGFQTEPEAKAAAVLLRSAIERGDTKFLDALRKRSVDRLGDLLESYLAAGCPDRHGRPRAAGPLSNCKRHIEGPLKWFADHSAAHLTERDRESYLEHRRQTVAHGTGERTTELELTTLNDALHWTWRNGDLKELPRSMRRTFVRSEDVAHARESMPADAVELHAIAAWQFQHEPVYGWLTLFKAFTGLRDAECQLLLAHPKRSGLDYPPGFIDTTAPTEGKPGHSYLRIQRVKRGRNPRVTLDDPQRPWIRPLLDMIRAWRAANPQLGDRIGIKPDAPVRLFPDAWKHTRSIALAAEALGLPRRTGHALRAYYATTRLAQGNPPEIVAVELGQGSGDELVRDVYGADPDDFDLTHFTSLADRFTWVPKDEAKKPAWTWWTERPSNIIALG